MEKGSDSGVAALAGDMIIIIMAVVVVVGVIVAVVIVLVRLFLLQDFRIPTLLFSASNLCSSSYNMANDRTKVILDMNVKLSLTQLLLRLYPGEFLSLGILSVTLVPMLCDICIIPDLAKDFFSIAFSFPRILTQVLEVALDLQCRSECGPPGSL